MGLSDRNKAFIVNRQQCTLCFIPFWSIVDNV